MFETIQAAKAAGYRVPLARHYGGEALEVKGRMLCRNPQEARPCAYWNSLGRRVIDWQHPHAIQHHRVWNGRIDEVSLYRTDQTRWKDKVIELFGELGINH